jgi:phage terminase small subunit
MPKPRKTLEQLAETGTLRKHIGRYAGRLAAQKTPIRPLGKPPAHLPPAEQKVWAELAKAAPKGLLQRSDRIFMELVARMVVRARTSGKTADVNALVSVLSKLGFTPTSRVRLDLAPPVEPKDKYAQDSAWDELDELD